VTVPFLKRGLTLSPQVVEVPAFPIPRNQARGGAWYLPWHKIGVWTLTDYDVVVYMDADVLALQDLGALATALDDGDDAPASPPAQWAASGCVRSF
jgi:hypothetical protein